MPTYAVHLMDQHGRRARARELHCDSDDEAMERLAGMAHTGGMELWHGETLVWRFEPRFTWAAEGPEFARPLPFQGKRRG